MATLDMSLLGELYEEIDRNPPGIEARKLLVEQFLAADMLDSVRGQVEELHFLCKNDEQVNVWFKMFCHGLNPSSLPTKPASILRTKARDVSRKPVATQSTTRASASVSGSIPELTKLAESYQAFKKQAQMLLRDMRLFQNLQSTKGSKRKQDDEITTLEALADGRITSVLGGLPQPAETAQQTTKTRHAPETARSVARKMENDPVNAFTIVMVDLENILPWLRSTWQNPTPLDDDTLRDLLARRVRLMTSSLPEGLQIHPRNAIMHMEHEYLHRKYVNDETMYGDDVSDIARDNFYATEDGYAWDMEELAQAIKSQNGIMRNPLSKHMFTPADIKAIVQHPFGQGLAALQMEQSRLKQGVRPQTLDEMDRTAAILLKDMADDALQSRHAVDEFLAYIATLPEFEQKAIENLRVPARDSHTGQAFDGSIGEAVRDAKANKLCFHKAGQSYFLFHFHNASPMLEDQWQADDVDNGC